MHIPFSRLLVEIPLPYFDYAESNAQYVLAVYCKSRDLGVELKPTCHAATQNHNHILT